MVALDRDVMGRRLRAPESKPVERGRDAIDELGADLTRDTKAPLAMRMGGHEASDEKRVGVERQTVRERRVCFEEYVLLGTVAVFPNHVGTDPRPSVAVLEAEIFDSHRPRIKFKTDFATGRSGSGIIEATVFRTR